MLELNPNFLIKNLVTNIFSFLKLNLCTPFIKFPAQCAGN